MKDQKIFLRRSGLISKLDLFMSSVAVRQKLSMKDHVRRISDINHMSAYKSQSILTSKSASIDAKAPEIHHRTMSHASNQKSKDTNKLVRENRIFDSCFL